MSLRTRSAIVATICLSLSTAAALAESGAAKLGVYDHVGQTHFALSLLPALKADPEQLNEVVILVDTSASQAGRYRDAALAALDSLLANLRPSDRVQLMAVDARAVLLTADFTAADSTAMQAAVSKLHARAPLGATDLESGLRVAAKQFQSAAAAHTVVYLGDAMSKANLFTGLSFAR